MKMNKLMGFYELKYIGIPTIRWEEFTDDTKMSDDLLWTVRTAVLKGNDYNLPRIVGVTSKEAMDEGKKLRERLRDTGVVLYYPYFIAHKSGTVKVSSDSTVIEAVEKDLWNLVTYGKRDVTIIIDANSKTVSGNSEFLNEEEIQEILKYAKLLHGKYSGDIREGGEIYLEWSYAYDSTLDKKTYGKKYLVFYEMRII